MENDLPDTPKLEADAALLLDASSSSASDGLPSYISDQLSRLQTDLANAENKRLDERFLWVLSFVVLFDVFYLRNANNWSAPIIIGILQLIGLTVVADQCSINRVMPLVDKFTGMFNGTTVKKSD